MNETFRPEVDKRYRVTYEIEVSKITSYFAHPKDSENPITDALPFAIGTWEEIEPEYVEGALYEDADGMVWLRSDNTCEDHGDCPTYSWRSVDGELAPFDGPKRPLERLWRDSEIKAVAA